MEPILADILERLQALHHDLQQAVTGLPPAALNWQPGPEMNSLAVLITHLAGAERYWIGDMAGQEPSGRVRQTEFQARAADPAELSRLLDDTLAHSTAVLQRLTLADLARSVPSPAHGGGSFRVAWCIAHALEHTAVHLGHVQLLRQLWEQQK
ncbi:MAG: DinB family protein [Anaerolineales bacterium]|nr:DinB family protein [Anaerolineales bacterium]